MGMFPLTFLSDVFVVPDTRSVAPETFVDVNPISILATASRGLDEGAVEIGISIALATKGALAAVFLHRPRCTSIATIARLRHPVD